MVFGIVAAVGTPVRFVTDTLDLETALRLRAYCRRGDQHILGLRRFCLTDLSRGQQRFIAELVKVVERRKPSPEELRYAFKRVRELTGIRRPVRPSRLPKFYTPAEVYALLG